MDRKDGQHLGMKEGTKRVKRARTHQLSYGSIASHCNPSPKKTRGYIEIKALRRKYQQWFTSRFAYTTFENEMKWYSTEQSPGKENYSVPDAMLRLMKQHKIAVRGDNIVAKYQPNWVKSCSQRELKLAAERRIPYVVSKYKRKLIGWDVINENLPNNYFESKLGEDASALFF
ncbi:hypothetical protein KPL71_022655 [Citrus sinensis]|uniref:Uncharacterized protein n=1 Tax=Citrus sinensis TaxID=2711 RepID=A0ACB8IE45_CITSI|nr:hypothetical protein KPL71_022655 [Citrus sinensis]